MAAYAPNEFPVLLLHFFLNFRHIISHRKLQDSLPPTRRISQLVRIGPYLHKHLFDISRNDSNPLLSPILLSIPAQDRLYRSRGFAIPQIQGLVRDQYSMLFSAKLGVHRGGTCRELG